MSAPISPNSPSLLYSPVRGRAAKRRLDDLELPPLVAVPPGQPPGPGHPPACQPPVQAAHQKSDFKRASRMARASGASTAASAAAYAVVMRRMSSLQARGVQQAPRDAALTSRRRTASGASVFKSTDRVLLPHERARVSHIASLKSRDVDTLNSELPYLLCGATTPLTYGTLFEVALRSNAVNSSVLGRRKTEAASSQTTRVPCKHITTAAVAQAAAVALSLGEARLELGPHY